MADVAILYSGPLVTKAEAIRDGSLTYFTGKPCRHGHIAEKFVSSRNCVECARATSKTRYKNFFAANGTSAGWRKIDKERQKAEIKQPREARKRKEIESIDAVYKGPIVTRDEALAKGLKRYFLGVPCKHGHIAQRFASKSLRYQGDCIVCANLQREAKRTAAAGRPRPSGCDVCKGSLHGIVYDHCHQSGKFRGWLCNNCNAALGFAKDSPSLLRKLAKYLEKHNGTVNDKAQEQTPLERLCGAGSFLPG